MAWMGVLGLVVESGLWCVGLAVVVWAWLQGQRKMIQNNKLMNYA